MQRTCGQALSGSKSNLYGNSNLKRRDDRSSKENLQDKQYQGRIYQACCVARVGDLGLSPTKCPKPTIVIIADSIVLYPQEMYEKGMKVITASTRRNSPQCVDPQIKSLNYLNNILAKIEANRAGVPEAIMLTPRWLCNRVHWRQYLHCKRW